MLKMEGLKQWVDECAALTKASKIHWCDGSSEEYRSFIDLMVSNGELKQLNPKTYPGCYLYRSHPSDVARTEEVTFVCTKNQTDAGPNNNWIAPSEAHLRIDEHFSGSMKGRTLYVIPYVMGNPSSPYARGGVEITDSPYVVINMHLMTRVGHVAMQFMASRPDDSIVRGLHCTGDLDPAKRSIMHFPNELLIKSFGSGYGGNALLAKKCHALRIASWQGREKGWLAEHMLIVGIENPKGEVHYIAAAFPSACGKTNLSMLIPPKGFENYRVWTVGDDICWLHPGSDGRLWAVNPENGFFGVVPGTNSKTNPNALQTISRDTIFTNVAVTSNNEPWWEGLTETPPKDLIDWQGRPYDPANGPAAHPNSRFTVRKQNCPSFDLNTDELRGVPISAIVFGGRRADLLPLVLEAESWEHGVFLGASMASESTAAATGTLGVVKRDPMAMRPFCGYNMANYWRHWLSFKERSLKLPRIFHVNWFRKSEKGEYLWPGFGENLRVLLWMLERCGGEGGVERTPIGLIPAKGALNTAGLKFSDQSLNSLFRIDRQKWLDELASLRSYFVQYGENLAAEITYENSRIESNIKELEH